MIDFHDLTVHAMRLLPYAAAAWIALNALLALNAMRRK